MEAEVRDVLLMEGGWCDVVLEGLKSEVLWRNGGNGVEVSKGIDERVIAGVWVEPYCVVACYMGEEVFWVDFS